MEAEEIAERLLSDGVIPCFEIQIKHVLPLAKAHLALLQKLREPTDEMINQGADMIIGIFYESENNPRWNPEQSAEYVFQAMIKVMENE